MTQRQRLVPYVRQALRQVALPRRSIATMARTTNAALAVRPSTLWPPALCRGMASAAAEPVVAELSTQTYNALVDPMLEELSIELEELLETHDIDALEEERGGDSSDWDVEYAVRNYEP